MGLSLMVCGAAHAEDRIGIVAPLSGPFARLGDQIVTGVSTAIAANGGADRATIVTEDDRCEAEGGAEAARRLIQSDVMVVIGFLCSESLEAALPLFNQKGVVVITPAIRSPTLTELRADPPFAVFRTAPSERKAILETGDILAERWRSTPFAIIDDGTISGRELAGGVRARLEEKGLKPVYNDTYRPGLDNQNALVGRLKRAGATEVFVGGERDDAASIGLSAQTMGTQLTIIGGEALNASRKEGDLVPGTLMVAPTEPQFLDTARNARNAVELAGKAPEGYTIAAFAATEAALNVLTAAQTQAGSISELLRNTKFETALGTLQFDQNGQRIGNVYELQRYDGAQFVPEAE
ncbi:branched-chain amino acid ABC transporter substrate-binding protein [Phyllobacterium sp. 21LDTY02-6]|uniref:branched-chain amino acid ABC transporter substrate-binding protein n=1 Tax=Phyllobacterium sp. 21LDTY02-6 TaxID=2944903 RepID=UPI00201FE6A8|nr:branched-chain amino acid ABC transporter substrate-binding protein [Phyllobacterium sp. 21LDTY02-6]MCO4316220.1 branched-chain amino acid ABC transporter substrate-binding protein [Phyllobacterium sp. 21LDTY02-6]